MTDIVMRLRETGSDLADDAADEIERLRAENEMLRAALRPHQEAAINSMAAEAQRLKLP